VRVSCLQENLAKGLAIVGRAVATRNTLPVLGNILLEAKDNQLRLAATNRQISISCWIGAKVEDEGEITVPARLISDFVSNLPPERVDLDLNVRTHTLHLNCAYYDATIKGIDAYDFPIIPTLDASEKIEGVRFQLAAHGLRKLLDQVIFAASADENKPMLTGVEMRFQGDKVTLAATDIHRLSVLRTGIAQQPGAQPGKAATEEFTITVPADSLRELARISADMDEVRPIQMLVTRARHQVLFQLWGKRLGSKSTLHRVELVSELIDGRFPDYQMLIPRNSTTRTVVETALLLKTVRMALLFAREDANRIAICLQPGDGTHTGKLRLTATSAELGTNSNEINAVITGNALDILFDGRFLIDILTRIEQPQVVLETTQSTRPCLIRPLGVEATEFLHMIMPMHPVR